ncbi:MAG: hydrogenase subunit MbhD domain-containing protein [Candidatus Hadarchaeum sp.]|uniref:hydrogenase subunit MbhD domain-containing protein n=1 Tax=Candidatus Hadarchaeum sp. TaxID=2883567 RepID=UPI003182ADF4
MIDVIIQSLLLILLLVLNVLAIQLKDLLYSVIMLGGASITLAVIFYMLQAPDIAITQAAVGAGVSTVLFIIAVSRTRREE